MINTLPVNLQNTTLAVTGHRVLPPDFDRQILKKDFEKFIGDGFDTFLCGMAVGFDMECFGVLLELKKTYPSIKLVAVVPCIDQSKSYGEEQKENYDFYLKNADYSIIEERTYFRGCMLKRNDMLIKNACAIYAFYEGTGKGGTYYTVSHAIKKGLRVFYYKKAE